MTVASTTTQTPNYACNGSTQEFAVSFPFIESSDLTVYLVTVATGAETPLTETTNYTVSGGDGTTGTITTVSTYSSSYEIYIQRNTDLLQSTDIVNQSAYYPEILESALDKLTMILQDLDRRIAALEAA